MESWFYVGGMLGVDLYAKYGSDMICLKTVSSNVPVLFESVQEMVCFGGKDILSNDSRIVVPSEYLTPQLDPSSHETGYHQVVRVAACEQACYVGRRSTYTMFTATFGHETAGWKPNIN